MPRKLATGAFPTREALEKWVAAARESGDSIAAIAGGADVSEETVRKILSKTKQNKPIRKGLPWVHTLSKH